jgi:methylated-DNA-[protein]-cysteine S-methyltransferase
VQFTVFETTIGSAAIAWGDSGVVGVALPESSQSRVRARITRSHPAAVACDGQRPADIQRTVDGIVSLLAGEPADLSVAEVDLRGVSEFDRSVYAVARSIPAGETLTYGEVAARLGDPRAAREVGQALGRNPVPLIVPCHRVVAAGGRLGGFSAPGGAGTKSRLLDIEGAAPNGALRLF